MCLKLRYGGTPEKTGKDGEEASRGGVAVKEKRLAVTTTEKTILTLEE